MRIFSGEVRKAFLDCACRNEVPDFLYRAWFGIGQKKEKDHDCLHSHGPLIRLIN